MKKVHKPRGVQQGDYISRLIFLIMFFIIGAVLGSYFAANMPESSLKYVENYIYHPNEYIVFSDVWKNLVTDLLIILLPFLAAFSRLGVIISPVCMTAKGFLLSMAVTSFISALGIKGYISAFVLIFLYGMVTLACVLLICVQSFGHSMSRWRVHRGRVYTDRGYFLAGAICIGLNMLASAFYVYLAPILSRAVSAFLFR